MPGLLNANGLLNPLLNPLRLRPAADYIKVPLSLLQTKYQATHVVQDLYTLGQVGSLYVIAYCVTHFVIMVAFALYVSEVQSWATNCPKVWKVGVYY